MKVETFIRYTVYVYLIGFAVVWLLLAYRTNRAGVALSTTLENNTKQALLWPKTVWFLS